MAVQHTKDRTTPRTDRRPTLRRPKGRGWQPIRIARLPSRAGAEDAAAIQKAPAAPPEAEPTELELTQEQLAIEAQTPPAVSPSRQTPAPGKDLLASYMEQLSHIPLFTPEEESRSAQRLEALELETWTRLLALPKAVCHLLAEGVELEHATVTQLETLLDSYKRAASLNHGHRIKPHPSRDRQIQALARVLRLADYDKELFERVTERVRREVWGRRVMGGAVAFRITHAELTELERARGESVRARNDFVRANLRLVVSVARNFHHQRLAFIDLIQEGNVGLMKAVHRFDHRRGFRFSTYAHWWIRQSIERAIINKGSQVRLPVHVIDTRRKVGRAAAKLTQEFGRTPTSAEIGKKLRFSIRKVDETLAGVQPDPVSLDEPVGDDDSRKLMDMVRNEGDPALDEALIRENTHSRVRELMHMLNPMEKDILRRRFGLGDDSDQTLDEIGKVYNLSRERVRQIQAQSLLKMRRMCERRQIS